jgi:hypothetical protein
VIETRTASLVIASFALTALNFLPDARDQIDNQRVDLAQVFASAFLWFQFAIANDDRQIPDLVKHRARDMFDRTACSEHGEADKQIIFKPSDVCLGGRSQIAVQRVKFGFKHRDRRRLPLHSTTGLFTFRLCFHATEPISLRRGGRAKPTALLTGSLEDALTNQSDLPGKQRFAARESPPVSRRAPINLTRS